MFKSRSRCKVVGNENQYLFNQKPHCSNLEKLKEKMETLSEQGIRGQCF